MAKMIAPPRFSLAVLAAALTAPASTPGSALDLPTGRSGLDLRALDTRIRPGDDFFSYSVGGWYANAAMPADRSEIGLEQEASDKVRDQLRDIVERSARRPRDKEEQLIGALYKSYLDERRVDRLGSRPLRPDLKRITRVRDRSDFAALLGSSWLGFGEDLFSLLIQPDARGPRNVLTLGQGGLGLPDRDYYLSPEFAAQRSAYEAYAARTLAMVGTPNAARTARSIVALETRIARVSWSESQRREVDRTYHPMGLATLEAEAPGFDWNAYLKSARVPASAKLVVAEDSAVRQIARIFSLTPLPTLKAWEIFHTVDNASPFLSRRFAESSFEFHNHDLMGMSMMRPRAVRAIAQVNSSLADAIGRKYAERYFPTSSKRQIEAMVAGLKEAMAARIRAATWMTSQTRAEARDKLARMKVFVGYPSHWRNYAQLSLRNDDLYGNIRRTISLDWSYQAAKVGKPVDPDEWGPFYWGIHPQTVDAFNIASENKIIFPAALLQPPEFDATSDPAVNFGGIGAVIGHEISHGFDDQGRKIDAAGRLRDWWTPEDAARYRFEADKLASQVDAYEILPGVHLNGRQTLGENIADLAGLLVALDAYHQSLGGDPPMIDGFTGDQRLLIAWGQKWRRKNSDGALRMQVSNDTHSPARFRAIGAVRNVDLWYRAFNVSPLDRYYLPPEKRARIW